MEQLVKWEKVLIAEEKSTATIKVYIQKAKYLIEWLDSVNLTIDSIDAPQDYFLHLKDKGLAPKSRNNYFTIAKEYSKYLAKKSESGVSRWILYKGVSKAEKISERKTLDIKQLQKLFKYAVKLNKNDSTQKQRDGLIVQLIACRGLRTIEVTRLKKSDLKNGFIYILGKGKSKKIDLTLPSKLHRSIVKYSKTHDSDYLFPASKGGQIDTSLIRRMIKKAYKEALNISDDSYNAHGFRHTLTQILFNKGVSSDGLHGVKRLLRHEDNSVINAYKGEAGEVQRRVSKERIEVILDNIIKV